MARTAVSMFIVRMEDGTFWYTEIPVGSIDGSNTAFTLTATPNPTNSLEVFLNGACLSLTEDYTLSGDDLVLLIAPPIGSLLKVNYRVEPT